MADGSSSKDPTPLPPGPNPPPKMHPAFLLVWIIGIGGFIVLAGCSLMLMVFALEGGIQLAPILGLAVMLAALYGFLQSLKRARRAELERQPPNQVLLYALLMPVVAAIVWGAGCMVSISGF